MKPITIPFPSGVIPVSREVLAQFTGEAALESGERKAETKFDAWGICVAIRAMAIEFSWDAEGNGQLTFLGDRTIHRPVVTPGTWTEGKVSVGGVKRRAFVSAKQFQLPGGKLVTVDALCVEARQ